MSNSASDNDTSTSSSASSRGSFADLVASNPGVVQSLAAAIVTVLGAGAGVQQALVVARQGEVNPDSLSPLFLSTFNLILRSVFAADGTTVKTEGFTMAEKAQLASDVVGVLQEIPPA